MTPDLDLDLGLTKACTLCRQDLPIAEFPVVKRRARRAPGSWCRPCIAARKAADYAANPSCNQSKGARLPDEMKATV